MLLYFYIYTFHALAMALHTPSGVCQKRSCFVHLFRVFCTKCKCAHCCVIWCPIQQD